MKLIKKSARTEKYYYQNKYLDIYRKLNETVKFLKDDLNVFEFQKDKLSLQKAITYLKKTEITLKKLSKRIEDSEEIFN